LDGDVTIPVVGIRQSDGQSLRDRLAAGQVQASVFVPSPVGTAWNVVAKPQGVTSCETVSGGHFDSVPVAPGADDNASGSAGVLELARVVAVRGEQRANCFVLFGAEELGLFGSEAYVASLSDADVNGLKAMLNLDVIGTDSGLSFIGDDDMIETARVASERVGVTGERGVIPSGAGSDHLSFQKAGVPVVFFYRDDSLIHTQQDGIERMNARSLEDTVKAALATLEDLTGPQP
jgi:Zn-dependent M28 family amino/carboxypeptidase